MARVATTPCFTQWLSINECSDVSCNKRLSCLTCTQSCNSPKSFMTVIHADCISAQLQLALALLNHFQQGSEHTIMAENALHMMHRTIRTETWMTRSRVTSKLCSSWTIKAEVTKFLPVGFDCKCNFDVSGHTVCPSWLPFNACI